MHAYTQTYPCFHMACQQVTLPIITKTTMFLRMKGCGVITLPGQQVSTTLSQGKLLLAGWEALCSFQAFPYPPLQSPQLFLSSSHSFSRPSTCPQGPSYPHYTSLPTFYTWPFRSPSPRSPEPPAPLRLPLLAPPIAIISLDFISIPPVCLFLSVCQILLCSLRAMCGPLTSEHSSACGTGLGMPNQHL